MYQNGNHEKKMFYRMKDEEGYFNEEDSWNTPMW